MKSIAYSEFIRVFRDLHEHLLSRGINTGYMRLDNESSSAFQREPKAKNVDFQLSPSGMHRRNAAQQAISTLKYPFIAGLFSTDPDFPMQNRDCLLEQAEIKLNLLRPSGMNPKLLAYSQINGNF